MPKTKKDKVISPPSMGLAELLDELTSHDWDRSSPIRVVNQKGTMFNISRIGFVEDDSTDPPPTGDIIIEVVKA